MLPFASFGIVYETACLSVHTFPLGRHFNFSITHTARSSDRPVKNVNYFLSLPFFLSFHYYLEASVSYNLHLNARPKHWKCKFLPLSWVFFLFFFIVFSFLFAVKECVENFPCVVYVFNIYIIFGLLQHLGKIGKKVIWRNSQNIILAFPFLSFRSIPVTVKRCKSMQIFL